MNILRTADLRGLDKLLRNKEGFTAYELLQQRMLESKELEAAFDALMKAVDESNKTVELIEDEEEVAFVDALEYQTEAHTYLQDSSVNDVSE